MHSWRKEDKDDPQKEITHLNQQYIQFYKQGRYGDAINIGTKLCDIVKQTFGKNHLSYANSLSNLANLYQLVGQYSKADPLYQKSLEI